ncbi:MAG: hypothetical protein ACFCVE_13890, partial [Phycisphaerae bacterium]
MSLVANAAAAAVVALVAAPASAQSFGDARGYFLELFQTDAVDRPPTGQTNPDYVNPGNTFPGVYLNNVGDVGFLGNSFTSGIGTYVTFNSDVIF